MQFGINITKTNVLLVVLSSRPRKFDRQYGTTEKNMIFFKGFVFLWSSETSFCKFHDYEKLYFYIICDINVTNNEFILTSEHSKLSQFFHDHGIMICSLNLMLVLELRNYSSHIYLNNPKSLGHMTPCIRRHTTKRHTSLHPSVWWR